jgi:hypothetical protein
MSDEIPDIDPEKEASEVVPDPPKPHKPESDDMPEWAKRLESKVDSLSERVDKVPEHESQPEHDKTPVREPWHKRGLGK